MAEVRLVDLEIIKRYSLAVRRETAPADELLAVLEASRATVEAAIGSSSSRAKARRSRTAKGDGQPKAKREAKRDTRTDDTQGDVHGDAIDDTQGDVHGDPFDDTQGDVLGDMQGDFFGHGRGDGDAHRDVHSDEQVAS